MVDKEIAPKKRPKKISTDGESDKWERDEKEVKNCLKNANYKCEFDENHATFISDSTKQNYVEAHHLIPLNHQDKFEHSLDVSGNLVSLCPNCHRKIHLAIKEEQKVIIEKLYNDRKELIDKFGISVSLEDLLNLY